MVNGKQAAARPGILWVLVRKFFMDVLKSPGLLGCCVFPVLFLALFRFLALSDIDRAEALWALFAFGMIFSTAMVPGTVTVYPIAEAREKHTLRTLMLAGVSRSQMLAARGLISLVYTALVGAGCYAVAGGPAESAPAFLLLVTLTGVPMTAFSLLLGLASRNQMAANFSSLPVVLVGILPIMLAYSHEAPVIAALAPTGGGYLLATMLASGTLFSAEAILPAIAQLAWIAVGIAALVVLAPRIAHDE